MMNPPLYPVQGTRIGGAADISNIAVAANISANVAMHPDVGVGIHSHSSSRGLTLSPDAAPRMVCFEICSCWKTKKPTKEMGANKGLYWVCKAKPVPFWRYWTSGDPDMYWDAFKAARGNSPTTIWMPLAAPTNMEGKGQGVDENEWQRALYPAYGIKQWVWCIFDHQAGVYRVVCAYDDTIRFVLREPLRAGGKARAFAIGITCGSCGTGFIGDGCWDDDAGDVAPQRKRLRAISGTRDISSSTSLLHSHNYGGMAAGEGGSSSMPVVSSSANAGSSGGIPSSVSSGSDGSSAQVSSSSSQQTSDGSCGQGFTLTDDSASIHKHKEGSGGGGKSEESSRGHSGGSSQQAESSSQASSVSSSSSNGKSASSIIPSSLTSESVSTVSESSGVTSISIASYSQSTISQSYPASSTPQPSYQSSTPQPSYSYSYSSFFSESTSSIVSSSYSSSGSFSSTSESGASVVSGSYSGSYSGSTSHDNSGGSGGSGGSGCNGGFVMEVQRRTGGCGSGFSSDDGSSGPASDSSRSAPSSSSTVSSESKSTASSSSGSVTCDGPCTMPNVEIRGKVEIADNIGIARLAFHKTCEAPKHTCGVAKRFADSNDFEVIAYGDCNCLPGSMTSAKASSEITTRRLAKVVRRLKRLRGVIAAITARTFSESSSLSRSHSGGKFSAAAEWSSGSGIVASSSIGYDSASSAVSSSVSSVSSSGSSSGSSVDSSSKSKSVSSSKSIVSKSVSSVVNESSQQSSTPPDSHSHTHSGSNIAAESSSVESLSSFQASSQSSTFTDSSIVSTTVSSSFLDSSSTWSYVSSSTSFVSGSSIGSSLSISGSSLSSSWGSTYSSSSGWSISDTYPSSSWGSSRIHSSGSQGSGSGSESTSGSGSGSSSGSGSGSSNGSYSGSSGGGDSSDGGGSSSKTAIVQVGDKHVALYCDESPDVGFNDTIVVRTTGSVTLVPVDATYTEVCEPGSIKVTSVVPDEPVAYCATVTDGVLRIVIDGSANEVVVGLRGTRRGFAGVRFEPKSREQALANNKFWSLSEAGLTKSGLRYLEHAGFLDGESSCTCDQQNTRTVVTTRTVAVVDGKTVETTVNVVKNHVWIECPPYDVSSSSTPSSSSGAISSGKPDVSSNNTDSITSSVWDQSSTPEQSSSAPESGSSTIPSSEIQSSSGSAVDSSGSASSQTVSSESGSAASSTDESSSAGSDSQSSQSSTSSSKTAIVPAGGSFVALYCDESPELTLKDTLTFVMEGTELNALLDPTFVMGCEPGTIVVRSICSDRLVKRGATVVGNMLRIRTSSIAGNVTVTVRGLRRGTAGIRFPLATAQQAKDNDRFWSFPHTCADKS